MIQKTDYQGDPRVGFFATFTGEELVTAREFKSRTQIERTEVSISRSRLVGLYTAGNENGILIPGTTADRERKQLEEANINYKILDSKLNAFGNLMVVNGSGALVHPKISHLAEDIEDFLNVKVKTGKIAGIPNVGACAVANDKGAVIHRDATEEDALKVKETLDLEEVVVGSINQGSPFIGSGLLVNQTSALVGNETTGPEIGRIDRNLF